MSEINIEVAGGSSVRLPTAGKYCDRNIVVTATGGGGADYSSIESALSDGFTNYAQYCYDRKLMTKAPAEILQHTASGTSFNQMFYGCSALTSVPLFDTSNGTTVNAMFYNCSALTDIPQFDTSSSTTFSNMFYGCKALTNVPQLDTSKGNNFGSMFHSCSALTNVSLLDTSRGTSFANTFYKCSKLHTIHAINISNTTTVSGTFLSCAALENITFNGVIKITGLDFSYCTKLTHDSLMSIINALYDWKANGGTSTYKLTLGSTNLAKLTDAEKAIATQKGWTLA